jgi:hypothetical protein
VPFPSAVWHRGQVSHHKEAGRLFRNAPFPLYGLPPSWTGERFLGGSAVSGETIHALSLGHGSIVEGRGATLIVGTATPGQRPSNGPLEQFASHLWSGDASTPEAAMTLYPEESMEQEPPSDLTPLPIRGKASIAIDGARVRFDVVFGNGVWAGRATVGSNDVLVRGRDWDIEGVALVRIVDLDPYIAGTRRFEALIGLGSRGYGPIGRIDKSMLPPGPTEDWP